jgi:hypothetical protein
MASLKGYIPKLADLLGMTPALLYERQRELVRSGLLARKPGHGPGSGVEATPLTVATLLIAATASNELSETTEKTRELSDVARRRGKGRFLEAVSELLGSPSKAETVAAMTISRSYPHAKIFWRQDRALRVSSDGDTFDVPRRTQPPVRIMVEVDGSVVSEIARDLAKFSPDSSHDAVHKPSRRKSS